MDRRRARKNLIINLGCAATDLESHEINRHILLMMNFYCSEEHDISIDRWFFIVLKYGQNKSVRLWLVDKTQTIQEVDKNRNIISITSKESLLCHAIGWWWLRWPICRPICLICDWCTSTESCPNHVCTLPTLKRGEMVHCLAKDGHPRAPVARRRRTNL